MQQLLDYNDTGKPVTLLQLMSITDEATFTRYDSEAAALCQSIAASE